MVLLTGVVSAATPARAEAQHVGFSIGIGFGFGYGGFYNPWSGFPYGPYGPYPYGPYPASPYPYQGYEATAVRLQATPKNAEVFVDGYRAGIVDDFDGTFQRLSLSAGQHEITVYLEGYRTWSQSVQANPGTSQNFKFAMEPLQPGETSGPRPVPAPAPASSDVQMDPRGQRPPMQMMPPQQIPGATHPPSPPTPPPPIDPATAGSVSINVQPGGADVFVDGEHWGSLTGGNKLVIRLAEGKHRIDVGKQGYEPYTTEVDVKHGEVTPVTVSLKK